MQSASLAAAHVTESLVRGTPIGSISPGRRPTASPASPPLADLFSDLCFAHDLLQEAHSSSASGSGCSGSSSAAAAAGVAAHGGQRRDGRRPRVLGKNMCMADGCAADLAPLPYHLRRHHICRVRPAHGRLVHAVPWRYGGIAAACQPLTEPCVHGSAQALPDISAVPGLFAGPSPRLGVCSARCAHPLLPALPAGAPAAVL